MIDPVQCATDYYAFKDSPFSGILAQWNDRVSGTWQARPLIALLYLGPYELLAATDVQRSLRIVALLIETIYLRPAEPTS